MDSTKGKYIDNPSPEIIQIENHKREEIDSEEKQGHNIIEDYKNKLVKNDVFFRSLKCLS